MKRSNKSKSTVLRIFSVLVVVTRCVTGQSYHYQGGFKPSAWADNQHFHVNTGSRFVEPIKAASYPLHYANNPAVFSSYTTTPSYQSPTGATVSTSDHPTATALYSGYYYVQDKKIPSMPLRRPPTHPASSYPYESPSHNYHSQVLRLPHSTRFPSFPHPSIHHRNSDTYMEAINLFSEVVRKLENEAGSGYQTRNPYHQSALSNGILGSSSVSTTVGGFPHHLDHIMGPEFIKKAEKLYQKIIQEQNERLRLQQAQASHQRYPSYTPTPPHILRGYNYPSYLSRNSMVSDSTSSPSNSLMKAVEITVPQGSRREFEEKLIQTSEETSDVQDYEDTVDQEDSASELSSQVSNSSTTSEIVDNAEEPFNGRDYEEHPLPYEEYEELVKDIAINHNFR